MKSLCGFVLALLLGSCQSTTSYDDKWNGTYIGYFHQNQQDTLPLTLVFEGSHFAAAQGSQEKPLAARGVFYEQHSTLVFDDGANNGKLQLDGVYRYDYGVDGSLWIWQKEGDQLSELILLQK